MTDTPPEFEPRETELPGPDTEVRLRIREDSLRLLLEGADVTRHWLEEEDPGVYRLHATATIGATRRTDMTPAVDRLVTLLNEFSENHWGEFPDSLKRAWFDMHAEWSNRAEATQ